jgi:signal transduction histidine kinase
MFKLLHDVGDFLKRRNGVSRGLSVRLLGLTILFVMIAEVMIYLPSAASFRSQWLQERVEAAQTASLAVAAAPDFMVSEDLARELLANAEVEAVALKRDGERQLILRGDAPPVMPVPIDLREMGLWRSLADTCLTLTAEPGRYLLITAEPRLEGGEFIEVLAPEEPLREALFAYSRRIVVTSVVISLVAGGLVFATLSFVFVRPMRRLARAMTDFRAAPDDATRMIRPSGRRDEIGQAEEELAALQEQVRQALRERERLAALGAAVAKINHDLRNILSSAQLVSDRLAANPDPNIRGQGERLVRSIDRGVRLAEEVLKFGRAGEAEPKPADVPLRPVVEDALADAASAGETPIGLDLDVDDAVAVRVDPEHLHRILLNLARNAVQALAGQEGRKSPGMVCVRAQRENGVVVVRVIDDGPGVPERARDRLFTPFAASTRKGGSGLGLSIARELARSNAGDLTLASTGPQGSVFELRLPAA